MPAVSIDLLEQLEIVAHPHVTELNLEPQETHELHVQQDPAEAPEWLRLEQAEEVLHQIDL